MDPIQEFSYAVSCYDATGAVEAWKPSLKSIDVKKIIGTIVRLFLKALHAISAFFQDVKTRITKGRSAKLTQTEAEYVKTCVGYAKDAAFLAADQAISFSSTCAKYERAANMDEISNLNDATFDGFIEAKHELSRIQMAAMHVGSAPKSKEGERRTIQVDDEIAAILKRADTKVNAATNSLARYQDRIDAVFNNSSYLSGKTDEILPDKIDEAVRAVLDNSQRTAADILAQAIRLIKWGSNAYPALINGEKNDYFP